MEESGKITRSVLETRAKITHTLAFPIAMYKGESSTAKKADRKTIDSFETRCWRRDHHK